MTFQEFLSQINCLAWRLSDGVVQGGPFKGLKLCAKFKWLSGEIANLLLGVYEPELQAEIAGQRRNYKRIINVGCSEGYYALGLARLNPEADVLAYDTDPDARAIMQENIDLNGLTGRVSICGAVSGGGLTPETLQCLIIPDHTFIFSDCEGHEEHLFDPHRAPALARADFLLESHSRYVTEIFPKRFAPTHDITVIAEQKGFANRLFSRDWLGATMAGLVCMRHWIVGRAKA